MIESEPQDSARHPETGGRMVRDVRPMSIEIDGRTYTAQMPGWYCVETGESMHSGADYQVLEDLQEQVEAERAAEGLPSLRERARARALAGRQEDGAPLG